MGKNKTHPDLSSLAGKWPSTIVARNKIEDFTGGGMKPGYMANLDSKGIGPPSIRIGRKIVYPVQTLLSWLESRSEVLKE